MNKKKRKIKLILREFWLFQNLKREHQISSLRLIFALFVDWTLSIICIACNSISKSNGSKIRTSFNRNLVWFLHFNNLHSNGQYLNFRLEMMQWTHSIQMEIIRSISIEINDNNLCSHFAFVLSSYALNSHTRCFVYFASFFCCLFFLSWHNLFIDFITLRFSLCAFLSALNCVFSAMSFDPMQHCIRFH